MITQDAFWIILTGALVAGSCALLGSFLVLRRLALLGDAISHAVLPGIVIAFALSNSRGSLTMFIGAVVLGLLTTFLVQFLSNKGVQGDAAIGVSFTFLFALGVVLVSSYGAAVDLDLDCVLYGEIAYTPFDSLIIGDQNFGPRPVWVTGGLFIINVLLVGLFYKQFKLCAFDPAMAAAVGINVTFMHYLLMGMVSVTTVGAFESVGAILVVAMLIVPGAAAYLLTDRLGTMLALAVGIGVVSSIAGYFLAGAFDASIAGSIATVCGLIFALAFLFSPRHGIASRALARWRLRLRVMREDALLWAWRRNEIEESPRFGVQEFAYAHDLTLAKAKAGLRRLRRKGLIERRNGDYILSSGGREMALNFIRRHRIFESYLDELGYAPDHIHASADRAEHYLTQNLAEKVEAKVERTETDPHGKPIPPKED